jgi:hypothetical protein
VQNCCDWDGNLTVLNSIGYVDVVTTGISPSLASTHLLCYPNPAADILTVEHEAYQSPQVIDIQGKVLPLTIEPLAIDKSKIDIESLPKGIYLIKAGNSFLKWAKNAQ